MFDLQFIQIISPLEMALQFILGVAGTSSLHPQDGVAVLLCALPHILEQVFHHELLSRHLVLHHHVVYHWVMVSQEMSQRLQNCQQSSFQKVQTEVSANCQQKQQSRSKYTTGCL